MAAALVTYGHLGVLQQVTLPSFGMICLNSQLTSAHPFLSCFFFFLLPSPSHGVLFFLGFENLFTIFTSVCMVF